MRIILLATALTFITSSQVAGQGIEPEVIGHVYNCAIEQKLKLGIFTARRTIREDSQLLDRPDSAQWHPHEYGLPQPGYAAKWYSFGAGPNGYHQLEEIDGYIQIYFSDRSALPKRALWKFKRPESRFESSLSAITSTQAEPKLSGTQFSIADMINFAAQSPRLAWSMERLSPRTKGQNVYHSGTFDMAGLHEARKAYLEAAQKLDMMQADYKNACNKAPIYADDHSELLII